MRYLSLFVFCLVSSSSYAQTPPAGAQAKPATSAGAATKGSGGSLELFTSTGFAEFNSSASSMTLSPGFNFTPIQKFSWAQLGGELSYTKASYNGNTLTYMTLMVGPSFNFGSSDNDAVFISLGMGIRSGSGANSTYTGVSANGSGIYLIAGKRYYLGGHWSYRPSIGMLSAGTSGLIFRPLAMSYFF